MLYLAEVQKKTRAFGSGKAEFRLLACQRAEYSWSPVGDEVIPAPDDVPYNSGALVLVDLSGNRSVQRYTEAGKQLVGILQNFSKLQEKFKTQEEDIEQWKQSLTYQSQELNRREMELEIRQEQVQDVEAELQKLESQREEIESAKVEVERLKDEYSRKQQELDGAWAHLNGERRRLEEAQSDLNQTAGLDAEQSQRIHALLAQLSEQSLPTTSINDILEQAQAFLSQQQETLAEQAKKLEESQQAAQQLEEEIERGEGAVSWEEWHAARDAWVKAQTLLETQRELAQTKRDLVAMLTSTSQSQHELSQAISQISGGEGEGDIGITVNIEALEQMPIDQLQSVVQDLKNDLEKNSRFVSIQEEELNAQQQDIDALRQRIEAASEYDRLQLETELSDELESYRMLNETLVGQRRNLQDRQTVLVKHEMVLARRQGLPMPNGAESAIDFTPILSQLEQMSTQVTEEISRLEAELAALDAAIAQQDESVQQQAEKVERLRQELSQREQDWLAKQATAAEYRGKIHTYQDILQPLQDAVQRTLEKINELGELAGQLKTASEHQAGALAEMQQTVSALTAN